MPPQQVCIANIRLMFQLMATVGAGGTTYDDRVSRKIKSDRLLG